MQQKTITKEDMDANPIIAALGGNVGDKISTALSDEAQAAKDLADSPAQEESQDEALG